jgi:hypothetical protein
MKRHCFNVCLACLLALLVKGPAGQAQPPPAQGQSRSLLVDYVSPSLLQSNVNSPTAPMPQKLFPPDATNQTIASPPRRLSAVDRREQFDAEFGIKQKNPSLVMGGIESAKFKLDETVFTAKEFVDTLHYRGYLKDVVGVSDLDAPRQRYHSDPIRDAWENTEVRTGIDWNMQSQSAFVGLRLVLPIGD